MHKYLCTVCGYIYDPSENDNVKFTYCHVSPNYIVSKGDKLDKGDLIGYVGPKYVYGVLGNQYSDENGIPTNGATTGCHLHFGFRINGKYCNPLDLFSFTWLIYKNCYFSLFFFILVL